MEPSQFDFRIRSLIYIFKFEDKSVKLLKKKFSRPAEFLPEFPLNLESKLTENTVVVVDDYEDLMSESKDHAKLIINLCNYTIHHKSVCCILLLQSYQIFYAKHRLHSVLHSCSSLILFRARNSFSMLKRFLNGYNVNLTNTDLC